MPYDLNAPPLDWKKIWADRELERKTNAQQAPQTHGVEPTVQNMQDSSESIKKKSKFTARKVIWSATLAAAVATGSYISGSAQAVVNKVRGGTNDAMYEYFAAEAGLEYLENLSYRSNRHCIEAHGETREQAAKCLAGVIHAYNPNVEHQGSIDPSTCDLRKFVITDFKEHLKGDGKVTIQMIKQHQQEKD